MIDQLNKEIDGLLREGSSKKDILKKFESSEDLEEVAFVLNEYPSLEKRKKFLLLHLFLTAVLLTMTGLKIMAAADIGGINLVFLMAMIVPAINMYVLQKLFRFRRTGYQFLFILSIIALFHAENHHLFEISMIGMMIILSGILYLKVFPKKEIVKISTTSESKDD